MSRQLYPAVLWFRQLVLVSFHQKVHDAILQYTIRHVYIKYLLIN